MAQATESTGMDEGVFVFLSSFLSLSLRTHAVCSRCPHTMEEHGSLAALPDDKLDGLILQLQQKLAQKREEEDLKRSQVR